MPVLYARKSRRDKDENPEGDGAEDGRVWIPDASSTAVEQEKGLKYALFRLRSVAHRLRAFSFFIYIRQTFHPIWSRPVSLCVFSSIKSLCRSFHGPHGPPDTVQAEQST